MAILRSVTIYSDDGTYDRGTNEAVTTWRAIDAGILLPEDSDDKAFAAFAINLSPQISIDDCFLSVVADIGPISISVTSSAVDSADCPAFTNGNFAAPSDVPLTAVDDLTVLLRNFLGGAYNPGQRFGIGPFDYGPFNFDYYSRDYADDTKWPRLTVRWWQETRQGVDMYTDPAGIMWSALTDGSDIYVRYREGPHATWSSALTVATSGTYEGVGITGYAGTLVVQANNGTTLYQWHSSDGGDTWTSDGTIS